MNFKSLQDKLREHLLLRIADGEFTGASLAVRAGFRQAHISNFLNNRRSLSLDAMDQVLAALHLTILDLTASDQRNEPCDIDKDFEAIPLVSATDAATARRVTPEIILDRLKFKKSFLRRLRPGSAARRETWTRFVLVKADPANASAMYPRIQTGATLLIDRRYNSLKPYRRNEPNLYLIRKAAVCLVRYVTLHGSQLSLRPQGDSTPLDFIQVPTGADPTDFIVGRICYIGIET